jgi:hypothetical protein
MSFFDYFRKMPKPPTIVEQPKPIVRTYGFFFKFFVNYTNSEAKKGTYIWTSDLYLDYNSALDAARGVIKNINQQVNEVTDEEFVFIVDISLKKESFISATATDPTLLVFANSVSERAVDIAIAAGSNATIQKSPEGDTLVGDYKIMNNSVSF